ncbi:MAG: hypothetical protein IPI46_00690 [Bacteroidetes bacterium]|nr:hypothetical protein [Bacteroidota bacterium]
MRLHATILLLWLVTLQGIITAHAQIEANEVQLEFTLLGNKEGLSQGYVPSMLQDKEGYIWFATKDGLNKYNGYTMKVYQSNDSDEYALTDNEINSISENADGNIWVGTNAKGLFLFDKKHERFIPVNLGDTNITAIYYVQYKANKLFVHIQNDIRLYDVPKINSADTVSNKSIKLSILFSYRRTPNPIEKSIGEKGKWFDLKWFPDQSIWLAMKDTMLILHPDQHVKHWTSEIRSLAEMGMKNEPIFHFFPLLQKHKIILIGTTKLSIYDTQKRVIDYSKEFGSESISKEIFYPNRPVFLNDTTLFFCSRNHWFMFNTNAHSFTIIKRKTDKGSFSGISHLLDRDGMIWIGTPGSGVYKANLRTLQFKTDSEDCFGFAEGGQEKIYVRFRSGIVELNTANKKRYPLAPLKLWNEDWVWPDIWCAKPKGAVWIRAASQKRKAPDGKVPKLLLLTYDAVAQKITEHSDLYDSTIYQNFYNLKFMFVRRNNDLCQLYQYDHEPFFKLIVSDHITNKYKSSYSFPISKIHNNTVNRIYGQYEDAEQNIWFATNAGLFYLNTANHTWKIYKNNPKNNHSIRSDKILCICPDPYEPSLFLWIGMNGSGFDKLNISTGQCEHYSTKNGLPNNVVYAILSDDFGNLWMSTNQGLSCFNIKQKTFRNYTNEDGLPGNEYNTGQYLKAQNGNMYFGGVDGITYFNPKEILSHLLPANPIVLTNFLIYNKIVNHKTDSTILRQPLEYTQTITLPAERNMFTIEFALLQFASSEKKHYKYFLKGFNHTWIDNGSKNSATFTNLDPGKYVFNVKGCNSDGVWSNEGASLVIIIKAPWFNTWWFRGILFVLGAASVYGFYRYRLSQSLKLISMRNVIASDLHDEIGSTISSISVYSDIIESNVENQELQKLAERISTSSRSILVVMSDIVWSINPKNDRFDNVILRMKSFAHEVLEVQNKQVHFDADPKLNDIKMQMIDRKNFYLIFKEALNNAVKYAKAKNVWISVKLVHNDFLFIIKDDGIGFDTSLASEGNGLLSMQRRSQELKGQLAIKSTIHSGTEIQLQFPIR